MTDKYWTLREELYRATHQWPLILVFAILGCLIGWASSYLWPSYYRSTVQIYVALNPYRTYSDTNFLALARPKYSNIDDYKDWQMSQLESVIYTTSFIQPVLEELRTKDPYWKNISANELRQMLEADWRSAGVWSLVAKHSDPQLAIQAVEAWTRVVPAGVKEAVNSAREAFTIDQELQALANQKQAAIARKSELNSVKSELLHWRELISALPQDQALEPGDRWRLLSVATQPAQFTPLWMTHLEHQPEPSGTAEDYLTWIDQIIATIDAEVKAVNQQIEELLRQRAELSQQFSSVSEASFGLSPNLEIEEITNSDLTVIRPIGTRTIIGGIVGLLLWILTQLIMITRKMRKL